MPELSRAELATVLEAVAARTRKDTARQCAIEVCVDCRLGKVPEPNGNHGYVHPVPMRARLRFSRGFERCAAAAIYLRFGTPAALAPPPLTSKL
jgi:hypothetical protein